MHAGELRKPGELFALMFFASSVAEIISEADREGSQCFECRAYIIPFPADLFNKPASASANPVCSGISPR